MAMVNRIAPAGEAWIAFPYNGALNFADNAPATPVQYRENVLGAIEFQGLMAKATAGANGDLIGTMPVNYRPPAARRFVVPMGAASIVISVAATGAVTTIGGATAGAIISFDQLRYYPT